MEIITGTKIRFAESKETAHGAGDFEAGHHQWRNEDFGPLRAVERSDEPVFKERQHRPFMKLMSIGYNSVLPVRLIEEKQIRSLQPNIKLYLGNSLKRRCL